MKSVLAFDFGASTGRAIKAQFDGDKIQYEAIHRFDNIPIEKDGFICHDVDMITAEIKKAIEKAKDIEVEYGGFYSLMDESFKVLWPQVKKTRSVNGFSLDIVKLDAEKRIERIVSNMNKGMITPDSSEENCKNCEYKRLCRGRFVAR